jgi:imidazolonepropionase
MRLEGKTYKEILAAGGGILQTVSATRKANEQALYELAQKRIDEIIRRGTTTVEIKSGYGLDTKSELKILQVIKRLAEKNKSRITIIPTFLGAHAIPKETTKSDYIKTLISEMIPKVAKENLAQFCDVFCENFVFTAQDSKGILTTAKKYGLIPKIHADEIEPSGGAEIAAAVGAISAEHLLYPSDMGLKAMKKKDVTAVLLPGTTLFLKSKQIPPVEKMRELGITIALGSDYNPGTCMIYQIPIIIALACLLYNLTLTEAIRGVTINSAKALGLDKNIGTIEAGKDADLLILDIPDYKHIPYQFGKNLVKTVIKKGKVIYPQTV